MSHPGAVAPPLNIENDHTNPPPDGGNGAAIMITVGILTVVFMWIVIIGCYYKAKNRAQDKETDLLNTKDSQSTTLLLDAVPTNTNDDAFEFVTGIHFISDHEFYMIINMIYMTIIKTPER